MAARPFEPEVAAGDRKAARHVRGTLRKGEPTPDILHRVGIAAKPERVLFALSWKDGQTIVLFSHSGWKEPVEFMHHCSTKWATFLLSLRDQIEKSDGHPTPRDVKIHVGD